MPIREFHLRALGQTILASLSWESAGFTIEAVNAPAPPVFTVSPSITGTPQVGETLTGVDGTITGGTVSARAWLRDGTPISGATGTTYLLDVADEDADISFRVTASGDGGTVSDTSDPVGPIAAEDAALTVVAADGWQATVLVPVDPPSLAPVTVTRAAFSTTGSATTIEDTVRLTKRVRQAYPNNASFTTDQVALSDYVYADDVIAGATNNSTEDSPKPIATWGMMDRTLVGNSIYWEVIPFHRNARLGRQVACVRVRATDGTNTTDWQNVSTTAVSTYCDGPNPVEVYSGTLDITGLTDDALITLQGQVFPWFGVTASILDSATETEFRFSPRYFYKNTTRAAAPNIICVASTGNDATGVVSTTEATAAATPCLTVLGAMARAAALLGSGSINILSGLEIAVVDGVAMGTASFTALNQDAAAIKVRRAVSSASRAAANITISSVFRPFNPGNSGTEVLTESAVIFEDVTITRTADVGFTGESGRRMHMQFRNVNFNFSSVGAAAGMKSNSALSWFGPTFSNYNTAFARTTAGDTRILRGASGMTGTGTGNSAVVEGYNVIGCDLPGFRLNTDQGQRGCILYNNTLTSPPGINPAIWVRAETSGVDIGPVAVVQNVIPVLTTGAADSSLRISGDSDNGNLTHVILHHNTTAGDGLYGRWNLFYDETPATARFHKLISAKLNVGPQLNTKGDEFLLDGTRLGTFAFEHGVGCAGVYTEDVDASGGADTFRQAYGGVGSVIAGGDILYTDDRATVASGPVAGTTGGDYTLQGGSPARDLVSEYLLGFDITGAARAASGTVDAGAYA